MPVEDRQENENSLRNLYDIAKMWNKESDGGRLMPDDLPWDRATPGVTKCISYYKGDMLMSMFLNLARKVSARGEFCGIKPAAHNKNAAWKVIRMAYQICHEGSLAYNPKFWTTVERLSELMTTEGVRVEDYV